MVPAWHYSAEPKPNKLLFIYCIISTLFCFRFISLAKHNTQTCEATFESAAPNVSIPSYQFPRKIWQTSKNGPAGLDSEDRHPIQSWVKLNQKHRYEILTAHTAESYVRDTFSHRQDIVETFTDLQDPILRADLIRYLVLLGDGGVYSDIDTMALRPIEDWVPTVYRKNASLVVGVEYDKLDGVRWQDWTLDLQFASWTVMAKPGHMFLEITVERVMERLKKLAQKQGCTISGVKASYHEVLDTTGPALFTEAVFEGLSYTTGTNFGSHNITGLTEPRLVGDVLILPINAFGSGQKHSNSGDPDSDSAMVQHLFKGTWKKEHSFQDSKEAQAKVEAEAEAIAQAELQKGEGDDTGSDQDFLEQHRMDSEAVGPISMSEP